MVQMHKNKCKSLAILRIEIYPLWYYNDNRNLVATINAKGDNIMKEKMLRLNATEYEGFAIRVMLSDNLNEYAKDFLAIFNNVKSDSRLLYMENHYNNDVTVYCKPKDKEDVVEWLKGYGKIKDTNTVLVYEINDLPDYDFEKYYTQVVTPFVF